MARHDDRAAMLVLPGNREIENQVQALENPVDPAALRIERGVPIRIEDIARADHVGAAEEHDRVAVAVRVRHVPQLNRLRSEEHTSELQSRENLVCRLLLEKKKNKKQTRQE